MFYIHERKMDYDSDESCSSTSSHNSGELRDGKLTSEGLKHFSFEPCCTVNEVEEIACNSKEEKQPEMLDDMSWCLCGHCVHDEHRGKDMLQEPFNFT